MKTATFFVTVLLALHAACAARTPYRVLPVNGGGFIQNVQICDAATNVWYTYVDVGGPYRSDDAGETWRPLHQNMTVGQRKVHADHIRSLSVDPRDADRFVFVAGWRVDDREAGLYVSRDGGRSYARKVKARFMGEGTRHKASGKVLRRDPANADRLIAGADNDGLFLSEDGGETWTAVGGDGYSFQEIWFDRARKGRVYAASPVSDFPKERQIGLLASDDTGRHWARIADEPPFEMCQMPGRAELFGLFATPSGNVIRVSADGGRTWAQKMAGLAEQPREKPPYAFCAYSALAAGPDFVLTASWGGRIFRLDAGATAWREIAIEKLSLAHPEKETAYVRDIRAKSRPSTGDLMIDPRNPDHVLSTDWFNIWESFDGCRTWRIHLNGIHQLVPFTLACDPHSPDNISYGCADMGMFNSQNGGKTYQKEFGICGANSIAYAHLKPHRAYAVGGKCGIQFMISEDGGATWRYSKYKGLPPLGQKSGQHGIYTVAVDPTTDFVYACVSGEVAPGKGGVWRSTDGGDTWTWSSHGMEGAAAYYKASEFSGGGAALWPDQLVFSPDGSAVTYGPCTGKMFYLDKATGRWAHVNVWNKGGTFTLAADPHRPGRFLLCEAGRIVELTEGGRKINWHLAGSTGLGAALAFDPHTPGLVVAATADAEDICVSRDGGRHWFGLDDGMKIPTGTQYKLVLDRQRLFVLTRGSGVWTRKLDAADEPSVIARTLTLDNASFDREVARLAATYPNLVRASVLTNTEAGTPIRLLTVTEFATGEKKPGYFIQGNIHSKELSGTTVSLRIAELLARDHKPGGILSKAVYYIVPRCNPDGAQRMIDVPGNERSAWGELSAEEGMFEPKDLDGDGLIAQMVWKNPRGPLVRSPKDPRCLVLKAEHPEITGPTYSMAEEGVYTNWKGKPTNKPWGRFFWRRYIDYNRNWEPGWKLSTMGAGLAPFDNACTRSQRDFILAHKNIVGATAVHNGWGMVFVPPIDEKDREKVLALCQRGADLSGFPVRVEQETNSVSGERSTGFFTDFCYRIGGFVGITWEVGTRETSAGVSAQVLVNRKDEYTAPFEVLAMEDKLPPGRRSVLPWKAFNHPQLGPVEIGGINATRFANPLEEDLEKTAVAVYRFVIEHAESALPHANRH